MNEELNQIVLQITTAPFVRALAQYGDQSPESIQQIRQVEIVYSDLTASEKKKFDDFVAMIKTK